MQEKMRFHIESEQPGRNEAMNEWLDEHRAIFTALDENFPTPAMLLRIAARSVSASAIMRPGILKTTVHLPHLLPHLETGFYNRIQEQKQQKQYYK